MHVGVHTAALDPEPAGGRSRTRCMTKERITASNMEGKKEKKEREARNPQSDTLSKLLFGMLVTPPALGKQLSRSGFTEKIIKTFSFKNIWQRLLHKLGGHFCPHPLATEKVEFKGEKTKTPPTFLMAAKKGLERACLVSERDTKKYSLALDR